MTENTKFGDFDLFLHQLPCQQIQNQRMCIKSSVTSDLFFPQ